MTPDSIAKVKAGWPLAEEAKPQAGQTNVSLTLARPFIDFAELVEWLVAHPGATHAQIGAAYGRPAGWFSTILVTEAFQQALDPRRDEVQNPAVTSTVEQRMQAMLLRSMDIIHTKMSAGEGDAMLALEAAKLSTKALGLGAAGRDTKPQEAASTLESLADRLTGLITSKRGGAIGSVPAATGFVEDVTPKPGSSQDRDENTAGGVAE